MVVLKKLFALLQRCETDSHAPVGDPAFEIDGRTGADIIPDNVFQPVSYPAGNADHLASFPDVTEFVLKATVAGVEMGLQLTGTVGAHKKINVFAF